MQTDKRLTSQSQAKLTADTWYRNARPQMRGAAVKGTKQYSIHEINKKLKTNCKSGLSGGERVGKRWVLAFSRHGETVGERGECPLLLGFGFLPLSLGVSFAWYGHIKLKCRIVRTCALRRKLNCNFCEIALSFKPPAWNSFGFIWEIIFVWAFLKSRCRRL